MDTVIPTPTVIVMTEAQLQAMKQDIIDSVVNALKPEAAQPAYMSTVEIAKALKMDASTCAVKIRSGVRSGRITRHETPGGKYTHGRPVYSYIEARRYLIGY